MEIYINTIYLNTSAHYPTLYHMTFNEELTANKKWTGKLLSMTTRERKNSAVFC